MLSTASDLEAQFLSSLPLIERIIAIQIRRHALSAADAEEFGAWAKARLIDGDYAVFRKFGGRSSLATYLTTVLTNLFRDYRNSRWGRWRPSAAAKRLGPVAVRLEELLYREGHALREAAQIMRTSGVPLRDAQFAELAARLPRRHPVGEVSLDTIAGSGAGPTVEADDPLADAEETARAVEGTLRALVDELPPEDALILRMRFWNEMTVADIARVLRLDQKALYRRIEGINLRLRAALESRGVDRMLASEVLNGSLSW
jgi:RNA polymerase sigma factor (sigma-70 family)